MDYNIRVQPHRPSEKAPTDLKAHATSEDVSELLIPY
jgi:hypothetical protein